MFVYSFVLSICKNAPTPAVVCYAADRNELRSRVIQWLQTEVVPDGWFVKGSNFTDILLKYFKVSCEKDTLDPGLSESTDRIPCFIYLCCSLLSTSPFKDAADLVCPVLYVNTLSGQHVTQNFLFCHFSLQSFVMATSVIVLVLLAKTPHTTPH